MLMRTYGVLATVILAVGIVGCGGGSDKSYNIGAIFPASDPVAKCAKYGGTYNPESILEECMVTKQECERAAGEWNAAMREGGVNDTINFSCD
jgi:hypothetical protein